MIAGGNTISLFDCMLPLREHKLSPSVSVVVIVVGGGGREATYTLLGCRLTVCTTGADEVPAPSRVHTHSFCASVVEGSDVIGSETKTLHSVSAPSEDEIGAPSSSVGSALASPFCMTVPKQTRCTTRCSQSLMKRHRKTFCRWVG